MKPVIFHTGAEFDFRSAVVYYESQRGGLGREFRLEVESAIAGIRDNPRAFPIHTEPGTRKCLLRRFPFTIFFAELNDSIWIVAVAHQKRRPGYWNNRRPE